MTSGLQDETSSNMVNQKVITTGQGAPFIDVNASGG